jgi:amino acid adenylation domain-containing protein
LNQTPSAFRQLIQAEEVLCRESELNLRYVIFGGEALDLSSLEPWFERHGDDFPLLVNMYGITETTVHVTYRPIRWRDFKKRLGSVIGEPIPDLSLYILDRYGQPVPIGVVGEIYVGGAGVARGYFNRKQLTAERMVPNPFEPTGKDRLYKTGDLARYLHNGDIEYLGRNDHQVKIRGFRIELGEIEAVLQRHPCVRDARVIIREESREDVRLVAYIVDQPDLAKIPDYETLTREQTQEWQYTFDETYRASEAEGNEAFNIAGWNSSYDGKPIPAEEMREWLNNTLGHIEALAPKRVLEIGCGTGMILFHVAPKVESYWATDFSQEAIRRLENFMHARSLSGVRLLHQEAIDFSNIPASYFDTIIINSVAQYFPSIEYFQQVIAGALHALAPGGSLFIGDNRHLPTLSAFQASVAFFQASDQTDWEAFAAQIRRIAEKENELVIEPAFFVNLPHVFETVDAVEVHLKGESSHNELTKYRYDVILHKKGDVAYGCSVEPFWEDWQQANLQLIDLQKRISQGQDLPIGWRGIPNARLVKDEMILQWSQGQDEPATLGELREFLNKLNTQEAVDPRDLHALAQESGYQVTISHSKDFGNSCFDVCFYPATDGKAKRRCPIMPIAQQTVPLKPTQSYWLDPLKGHFAKSLIPELKQLVREQLPDYMQPSAFVLLDRLPMTPSGKLDRRALPEPDQEGAIATESFVKPTTRTQERLCKLWSDVLGLDGIGITDDFFHLGGHSLLATKLVSRIREEFNLALPLRSAFEYPTVAGLAERIDQLAADSDNAKVENDIIPRVFHRENLPLSFAQQRLWFLDQLEPDNPAYNIVVGFRMDGRLNREALHCSLQEIVKRHEVLRTTFSQDANGNPVQIIPESNEVSLTTTDFTHLQKEQQEEQLKQAVMIKALRPFNLRIGPLLRVHLYRLKDNAHVFVAVMHHIVSDAWSLGLMVKELSQSYAAFCNGNESPLPPLSMQYADFAHWQRTTFEKTQLQKQLDYWKQELSGEIHPLELPTDFPRPAIASYKGRAISFTVDRKHYERFKQLCESQGATLFMGLLGVFKTLLMCYSGQHDLLVGTPIANRNRKQIEDLIGFFVNTLVIRTDVSDNPSFTQLLTRIKEKTLQAYVNQDLPFEKLVEELQPERNLSYSPLFQVMFVLQNAPIGNLELPNLSLTSLSLENVRTKFDLTLSMTETEKGLQSTWEYKTDLFEAATITRMAGHFQTLLEAIVANPEQHLTELSVLSATERHQLLVEWNDTHTEYPQDSCLHHLFEAQVERTPNRVAVVFEDQQLTYRELNARANQLAHYLQALGVGPDVLVSICMQRSIEMVVGLLGVLKAGGAYLPLDPTYPKERLTFMLSDAQTPVLLTQQILLGSLPEHRSHTVCLDPSWEIIAQESEENLASGVVADNLAYTIYTSGSTGNPKGVMLSHRAICNHMFWMQETFPLTQTDKVLQKTPFSFDASVWEFYAPLLVGAQLVMARPEGHQDSAYLIKEIADQKVNTVQLVPSLLRMLLEQGGIENSHSLRNIFCGGEALPVGLQERLEANLDADLHNLYGPTEACIDATFWTCDSRINQQVVPIGRPISNTQIYILDSDLEPLPIGVPGELHIGGVGLARGYFNRPTLTAEKFIPNPFSNEPGARFYKTGDLARYLPDGNIEFLGRIDNQVKIRGFRIELGEIETALAQHPAVREAVVLACEDQPGDKRLVAYVVPRQEQVLSTSTLRGFLKEKLPNYMIPGAFVMLDKLPLTPNGKVDKRALSAPSADGNTRSGERIPPRTPLEQKLVELWEEVLQVSRIGVTENFFDLGGHSLLAIRLIAEIENRLGYSLPLATLFRESTVENIALQLERDYKPSDSDVLVPLQTKGDRLPLFLVHQAGGYGLSYSVLADVLGKEQPLYALQSRGLDGKQQPLNTVEAMASTYIKAIREILPYGPYLLGGHSFGGLVAFEMASQLEAAGERVEHLFIIDIHSPLPEPEVEAALDDHAALLGFMIEQIGLYFNKTVSVSYEELSVLDEAERFEHVLQLLRRHEIVPPNSRKNLIVGLLNVYKANVRASLRYQPKPIKSSLSVFKTTALAERFLLEDPTVGWRELTSGQVRFCTVSGEHQSLLKEPHVKELSAAIEEVLHPLAIPLVSL